MVSLYLEIIELGISDEAGGGSSDPEHDDHIYKNCG